LSNPILVTGAAGRVAAVGRKIAELLLQRGLPVRAMVRRDDDRVQALRERGAAVAVGDLLDLDAMHRAIAGCDTTYFGMPISESHLAATVDAAAVAKHHGVKAFVNMSQMTAAQMSVTETTASPQQKPHWLAEQALTWSGLPVVHVRPTVLLEASSWSSRPSRSVSRTSSGCRSAKAGLRRSPSRTLHASSLRCSPIRSRTSAGPISSPDRSPRTWSSTRASSRRRSGARSPIATSPSRRGAADCSSAVCRSTWWTTS
jgi:nucleoside-diphosphate-sugar epimerase